MVGLPCVQSRVKQPFIVEIAVAPIHRQAGRRYRDEERSRSAPDHLVLFARSDDDHLVAEARGCPKLRLDIGSDASARRCVKGRNVDDPHRPEKAGRTDEVQVKLC